MTIDMVTLKSEVVDTISDLTGLNPLTQIKWRDEPAASSWDITPIVYLRVTTFDDIGWQEERRGTHVAGTDDVVTVVQQKLFTLSLRCESYVQDISDPRFAGTIMSSLTTRLRRSTTTFDVQGSFAVAIYGPTKWFNYIDESDRQVSCYVKDLRCVTVDYDIDTMVGAGGYINEAIISGSVLNQDGSTIQTVSLDVKGTNP